jgi:hypothetical protein
MLHPNLGPLARLTVMLAVHIPSLAAGAGTALGLIAAGAPPIVAALPAGLVAIAGIITLTHSIETLIQRQAAANQQ